MANREPCGRIRGSSCRMPSIFRIPNYTSHRNYGIFIWKITNCKWSIYSNRRWDCGSWSCNWSEFCRCTCHDGNVWSWDFPNDRIFRYGRYVWTTSCYCRCSKRRTVIRTSDKSRTVWYFPCCLRWYWWCFANCFSTNYCRRLFLYYDWCI